MKLRCLEAMRFIFMTMICLWHYQGRHGLMTHGYIGVEFFFILSGILLFKSYDKINPLSPLDYSIKKFKRFFPKYFAGLIISFCVLSLGPHLLKNDFSSIFNDILRIIPEAFMIQNVGFYQGGINYPLWYLCVLLVGGGLIYSLLYLYKNGAINLFIPVLIIATYSLLVSNSPNHSLENFNTIGVIYLPMARGCADIGLGVLIGYLVKEKSIYFKRNISIINLLAIGAFAMSIVSHFLLYDIDVYTLIFFTLLLIDCLIPGSLMGKVFNHKIWEKLGKTTFSMLVLHASIIAICSKCITPIIPILIVRVIIYLLILIGASLLLDYCFDVFKQKKKRKNSFTAD